MRARTFAWLALGLIIAAGLGLAGWVYQARRGFESRVEALRNAGEPVDLSEIPNPEVPDEENAAPLLRGVLERLDHFDSESDEGEHWRPYLVEEESLEANQLAIEARASLYAELDAALERPGFRLPDDPSAEPLAPVMSSWSVVQRVAGYLDARAKVDLATPDGVPRATLAVSQLMRLASYVRSENAISHIVRIAVEHWAIGHLRPVMAASKDPEALRARLDPLFAAADDETLIRFVFKSERVWMITMYQHMFSDDLEGAFFDVPWHKRSEYYRQASKAIDQMGRAIEAVHGSAPETVARLRLLDDTVFPALGIYVSDRLHLAVLRTARVALALEVHHALHGRYPSALSQLAPLFPNGVPLEPYTGAPFRYESTSTTAVLGSGLDEPPPRHQEEWWNAISWKLTKN